MPQFLPKEAEGEQYTITTPASDRFVTEIAGCIHDVAKNMAVQPVDDVGRVPSLFSRAYSFYTDLFPEVLSKQASMRVGRAEAQRRARRQFRGIAAVLALRETLSLRIRLNTFKPNAKEGNEFRKIFAGAYAEAPGFKGQHGWKGWQDFSFLEIWSPGASRPDPLCGLSPYTLFFPSAGRIKACRSFFWYDSNTGQWFDPTTDWQERPDSDKPRISYDVIRIVRGQIHNWLDQILATDNPRPEVAWKLFGMEENRAKQMRDELEQWRNELNGLSMAQVRKETTNRDEIILNLQDEDGRDIAVPVLEQVLGSKESTIVTELPMVNGKAMLSKSTLTNPDIRICGTLMGKPGLERSLEKLDAEGDEFVIVDGENSYPIKLPYVVVDRLFLDTIHLLADGILADNFFGLTPQNSREEEHWMFPFRPEMLRYLDIDKLRSHNPRDRQAQVSCMRVGSGGNEEVKVDVKIGGRTFSRSYPDRQRNRDTAGNMLDIRIWPNFRFTAAMPREVGDRMHYLRIRQLREWELRTKVLARSMQGVEVFNPVEEETGWKDFCLAKFYMFPSTGTSSRGAEDATVQHWEPVGICFEDRGLCLVRLKDTRPVGGDRPVPWRIGVDFGTSNTCVTFITRIPGMDAKATAVRFEMQTDTMHEPPIYERLAVNAPGRDVEGAAAVLDFPYKYEKMEYLTDGSYFPSQFVTRQANQPQDANFRLTNGLIFSRNVILDNKDIQSLLFEHPPSPQPDVRPFRLFHNIKWKNKVFRKAFLWHLYKMINAYASGHGAQIEQAAFSYPRAFDQDDIKDFSEEVRLIFGDHGKIQITEDDFVSESDAVQRWMLANPGRESHFVLDVGGGTTDYLGLIEDGGLLQASHYFAGSFINDYFEHSPSFRGLLRDAIYHVVEEAPAGSARNLQKGQRKLLDDLLAGLKGQTGQATDSQVESYSQQAFFGLLGMMEERHYPGVITRLRAEEADGERTAQQKAVCGFFYTLTLLYMGMVYMAGRLLKEAKLHTANLSVDFIGNGSKFYRFLHNRATPFEAVLAGVLHAGYGGTDVRIRSMLEPEGKTFVAKGLLVSPGRYRSAPVVAESGSMQYLKEMRLDVNPDRQKAPDYADLMGFLQVLGTLLPGGKLDGATIIPYCQSNIVEELKTLLPNMTVAVRRAEQKVAAELQRDLAKAAELQNSNAAEAEAYQKAAQAKESVFIIRLKCLLEQIRVEYGL